MENGDDGVIGVNARRNMLEAFRLDIVFVIRQRQNIMENTVR